MSRPSTDPTTRVVVFGILTLADGVTPMPNVTVNVTSSDGSTVSMIAKTDASACTNKFGAFLLYEAVAPGTYTIIANDSEDITTKERLVVAKTADPMSCRTLKRLLARWRAASEMPLAIQ